MGALAVEALGDSVTVGVGDHASVDGACGWAEHLAVSLGATSFVNRARTGARARDVVAEQLPRALTTRPDLVTLLVGGNDVLRADLDPDAVAASVALVCDQLTEAGSVVLVVLLHDPARVLPRGGGVFGRVIGRRATAVTAALERVLADRPDVVVLDPRGDAGVYDPRSWHIDRMHPSAVGHRRLAVTAGRLLAAHGIAPQRPVPPPPSTDPGAVAQALWIVRNGLPWFAKRSVDLVPELVRVVISERAAESVTA